MQHKAESNRRCGQWAGMLLAMVFGVLTATPALARPAGKRIAVLPPDNGASIHAIVTAKIAKALKARKIRVVTGAPVKRALARSGTPSLDDEWAALARRLKVHGTIETSFSRSKGKQRVEVIVHNGADGSVLGRGTFAAKGPPAKLAAATAAGLWKKLGSAIRETSPPMKAKEVGGASGGASADSFTPAAESGGEPTPTASEESETMPEPEESGESEEAESEEPELPSEANEYGRTGSRPPFGGTKTRGEKRPSWRNPRSLEAELGVRVLQRVFAYTPGSASQSYVKRFVPVLEGRVAWFPITYAGLFLSGEFNAWMSSESNPSYPTGTRELVIGAQGRYPLSFGILGLSAGYFQHLFVLGDPTDSSGAARSDLSWPDVAYQGVRIGINGTFYLTDWLQAGADLGYRKVTSPGDGGLRVRSSFYFPNASTGLSIDGVVFAGVRVLPWMEIRGAIDYRSYSYGALQPGQDNAGQINATGATDRYLGFTLGAVGIFGGK